MTSQSKPSETDIVKLERAYWDAMKEKNGAATARLSGDPALVTGPRGVMSIARSQMAKMTESGDWELEDYSLDDIEVSVPTPDVAVIVYTVRQKVKMKGETRTMRAADSSTWVRGREGWECLAHSETILS